MVEELPKACDVGVKKNAKGVRQTWVGYKLHIDAADGGVPVSCLLTRHRCMTRKRPSHWRA